MFCKEFGKAKVYIANQDNFPTTSKEELAKLDEEIKKHKDVLQQSQQKLKDLQVCKLEWLFIGLELKDVSSGLSNEQMRKEIDRLKAEVFRLMINGL